MAYGGEDVELARPSLHHSDLVTFRDLIDTESAALGVHDGEPSDDEDPFGWGGQTSSSA